jgi:broad specificity phosphatase PhoE
VNKNRRLEKEYITSDSYNPGLATFQSTGNKSNNGYTQSMEMGQKILSYVQTQIKESVVVLKFHTSPYLRCIQTIKFMIDYITKKHKEETKTIKIIIYIDHFLSEWLNSDLDINYYPPNDNGETLLSFAIQYLNSNLNFSSGNELVDVRLNLSDSYKFGNPGQYNESFIQQYARVNRGLISLVKDACENISQDPNQKEILLVMSHGAVVRSLTSKLIGKSLYVEIPLASISIAKPVTPFQKGKYLWRLLETDIEIRSNITFGTVDIFSSVDPFQDVQLTFNHNLSGHLNFKNETEKPSPRVRFQSLLTSKLPQNNDDSEDSDDSDDSDSEGITFNVGRRRPNTTIPGNLSSENQKRFRSTSLIDKTTKNSIFNNDRPKRSNDFQVQTPKPVRQPTIILDDEWKSTNHRSEEPYQNIDVDDGSHNVEYVPDLEELSSNNSSSNSLNDSINQLSIFPGSFSTLKHNDSHHEDSNNLTPTASEYAISKSANSSVITLQDYEGSQSSNRVKTLKGTTPDQSLIERSLNEILNPLSDTQASKTSSSSDNKTGPTYDYLKELATSSQDHAEEDSSNWLMSFGNRSNGTQSNSGAGSSGQEKFKIDLYGKRNRFGLNLYDDDETYVDDSASSSSFDGGFRNEASGTTSWFLGSNKY